MTIREIVQALGGDRKVAAAVGLRPSAIRMWVWNGYVPPKHHATVQDLAGRAGVSVTPEELDPPR